MSDAHLLQAVTSLSGDEFLQVRPNGKVHPCVLAACLYLSQKCCKSPIAGYQVAFLLTTPLAKYAVRSVNGHHKAVKNKLSVFRLLKKGPWQACVGTLDAHTAFIPRKPQPITRCKGGWCMILKMK